MLCNRYAFGGKWMVKKHFAALDGLRGLAAIVVVVHHMTLPYNLKLFPNGHLAVDFFFALSGFVVAFAYQDKLINSRLSVWEFCKIRIIRLHPLIVAGLIIGGFVYSYHFGFSLELVKRVTLAFTLGLLIIPNAVLATPEYPTSSPLNPPAWSLFVEYTANILFAVFCRHLTISVLIMFVMMGAALDITAIVKFGTLDIGYKYYDWWWGIARVVFPFFSGVLMFKLWSVEKLKVPRLSLGILSIILVVMFMMNFGPLFEAMAALIIIPLCVSSGIYAEAGRLTQSSLWAGRMSYPIYILHSAFTRLFLTVIHHLGFNGAKMGLMCIVEFLTIVAISWIAMTFYDEPFRAWISSIRKKAQLTSATLIKNERQL
jgi:peptidoglycan/LPS O-acetylase OafA/YrhL